MGGAQVPALPQDQAAAAEASLEAKAGGAGRGGRRPRPQARPRAWLGAQQRAPLHDAGPKDREESQRGSPHPGDPCSQRPAGLPRSLGRARSCGGAPTPIPTGLDAPIRDPCARPAPPPPPTCPRAPRPPPTRHAPLPRPAAAGLELSGGPERPSQRQRPPPPRPAAMDVYPPHRLGLSRARSPGGPGRGSPSVRYSGPRTQRGGRAGGCGLLGSGDASRCRAWSDMASLQTVFPKRLPEGRFPRNCALCSGSHNGYPVDGSSVETPYYDIPVPVGFSQEGFCGEPLQWLLCA